MKNIHEITTIIIKHKNFFEEKYHIKKIGIFGSYVRGEQTPKSDRDILVEFDPEFRFGLLTFCQLEREISNLVGIPVDLVMKDILKPTIGKRILAKVMEL
jgi:uncharacterized protein